MASEDSTKKKVAADKAYELTDENFETETVQEKLSTFRRKRLAEKRYAFTDDAENITPLSQVKQTQFFNSFTGTWPAYGALLKDLKYGFRYVFLASQRFCLAFEKLADLE